MNRDLIENLQRRWKEYEQRQNEEATRRLNLIRDPFRRNSELLNHRRMMADEYKTFQRNIEQSRQATQNTGPSMRELLYGRWNYVPVNSRPQSGEKRRSWTDIAVGMPRRRREGPVKPD